MTTVREIKILKALNHKNVVPILDMVVQQSASINPLIGNIDDPETNEKSSRQEIFMVFPYMDHDLCGLLGNQDFKMQHSLAKLFMKQILEGMAYIHAVSTIILLYALADKRTILSIEISKRPISSSTSKEQS